MISKLNNLVFCTRYIVFIKICVSGGGRFLFARFHLSFYEQGVLACRRIGIDHDALMEEPFHINRVETNRYMGSVGRSNPLPGRRGGGASARCPNLGDGERLVAVVLENERMAHGAFLLLDLTEIVDRAALPTYLRLSGHRHENSDCGNQQANNLASQARFRA